MEVVYLKDGAQANLIAKTDAGFVIDRLMVYEDEDEVFTEPSGKLEVVDKVYTKAPIELIETEYKELLTRIEEQEQTWNNKQKELRELSNQVQILRNQKTDLSRFIINREELRKAKRLIVWVENEIAPRIMGGDKSHKFSISYEISQYGGEERCWCYKPNFEGRREDGWSTYSNYFDKIYGIKTDLTDEDILTLTIARIPRFKNDYSGWESILRRTDDKWLSPEYIEEKKRLIELEGTRQLQKAEEDLKKAQAAYDRLVGKDIVAAE